MLSLEKGMGATPGYNHRLRLRNTLPSAIKGRLQFFPILNCLLFEGMLLHTGMYFFCINIIFIDGWRRGSLSVEVFVFALCFAAAYLQFPECPWEGAASLVSKDVAGPQTKDRLIFRAGGACTN